LIVLVMGFLTKENETGTQHVRAHALVATGKICMRYEDTAKSSVHMFLRELNTSNNEVIRSNVVVILGDLCRRYTNLIDRHLNTMSSCLSDPSPLVRRHALVLLTGLLQEDYIKWKGTLFVRFLACIVDPNSEIASLSRYALTEIFPQKCPGLLHGQFVETLFALNGYTKHPKYQLAFDLLGSSSSSSSSTNDNLMDLDQDQQGEELCKKRCDFLANQLLENPKNRMNVLLLMLEHMTDPHRLETTNKICRDVLGGILDGVLPVPENKSRDEQLFKDALDILCSDEIKVKASRFAVGTSNDNAEDMTADTSSAALNAMAAAKGKVLSKLERKNVMENVVPLVISLYRKFQQERSGLLRYLLPFMSMLMQDYKEEVNEVLGADRVIADEIEYDLQKQREMEAEQERKEALRKARSTQKNSTRRNSVSFQANASRRRSSIGLLSRTPIPTSRSVRQNKSGNRSSTFITPLTSRVVSTITKPALQPHTAPRLRAPNSSQPNVSGSQRKKVILPNSTPLVPVEQNRPKSTATARKWSLEPSKAQQTNMDNEEIENTVSQKDLTLALLKM